MTLPSSPVAVPNFGPTYVASDRSIWIQDLNLTDTEKLRLLGILQHENQQPYLYNYYISNCSTKVRDALDHAVEGQIHPQLAKIDTLFMPTSPRWSFLSSSLVREVARFGGDVSKMVPPQVAQRLKEQFAP